MNKEQKATISIAILIALFLIYISIVSFVSSHPYLSIFIGVLIVAGIGLLIYYTIKYPSLKEKEISFFKFLADSISALFKGGKEKKARVPISPEKQKQIFERADNRCQHCGKGNVKLHIHHINGDPSNNSIDNLIVLCPNDHSIANSLPANVLRNEAKKAYHLITIHKKDLS